MLSPFENDNDKRNGYKKFTDLIDNQLSISIFKLKNRKNSKPNRKENRQTSVGQIFVKINGNVIAFKHWKIENNNQ